MSETCYRGCGRPAEINDGDDGLGKPVCCDCYEAEPMLCDHANEVPVECPCDELCYCRSEGSCLPVEHKTHRKLMGDPMSVTDMFAEADRRAKGQRDGDFAKLKSRIIKLVDTEPRSVEDLAMILRESTEQVHAAMMVLLDEDAVGHSDGKWHS